MPIQKRQENFAIVKAKNLQLNINNRKMNIGGCKTLLLPHNKSEAETEQQSLVGETPTHI